MSPTPEDKAREVIDRMLVKSGWHVCNINEANIYAHREIKTPNLKRAERLQQAILKRAFTGKLTATKVLVLEVNNVE